ncbi:MAG: hypothetical protein HY720_27155 [Planctomycetes bacterium]|nr:hypothetical protein [Planctomycetota bacterium]
MRTPVEPGARVTEEEIRRALEERAAGGRAALPARLAVVELVPAGYETVQVQPIAVAELDAFRKGVGGDAPLFERAETIPAPFLPVTVDLANLRYQAARFGADGLLLLTRGSNSYSYANGWAFLYPTIVGLAFAPGNTREVWTAAAAVLLDVSSGRPLAVIEAEARVDGQYLVFSDEWAANRDIDEEARTCLFHDIGERLRERAGELRLSQGLPARPQGLSSK